VQLGYDMAREKHAAEELAQANQRLRIEVDWLKSPARVEELAKRELHMEPPDPTRIRVIPRTLSLSDSPPTALARAGGRD
jgi:cell division protein FtsL